MSWRKERKKEEGSDNKGQGTEREGKKNTMQNETPEGVGGGLQIEEVFEVRPSSLFITVYIYYSKAFQEIWELVYREYCSIGSRSGFVEGQAVEN